MQKIYCLTGLFIFLFSVVTAQDEGVISKRERINLSSNIYVGGGVSFTFGDNIGDYSRGYNLEGGYLKRLNRVLSIGGGLSYQTFKYDPEKTGAKAGFVGEEVYIDNQGYTAVTAATAKFDGGKINLISITGIIKLNFVPVKDESKFSVYAFAKPFVSYVNRGEVTGVARYFGIQDTDFDDTFSEDEVIEAYLYNYEDYALEAEKDRKEYNGFSGGIFIGPGIEMNPGKAFSISLQASVGYTFPISFISSTKYEGMSLDEVEADDEYYPMTKEGFPSLNIQLGFSYNF